MGYMKKYFLSIIILFQVAFLSLGVGISCLAANKTTYAYANALSRGVEVISEEPPTDLAELQGAGERQLDFWAENLTKFDGREFNYITPEGNQGSLGICWAYSAVGAVEANILRNGVDPSVDKSTLDLDEMIAAYSRFNRDGENDPLYLTTNDTYSKENWRSSGDFPHNALMSMTQGFSLVDQVSNWNWNDWALKQRISQSKYFVRGFKQIAHNEDDIKRAILEYGAVTMEYKAPDRTNQKYVHHAGNGTGHASLIIGWDDSISSTLFTPDKPSSDGAWIIKNSWGPSGDYGVNGTHCFYLSYESYMTDNLYVVDLALRKDYQNIYYYDGNISDDTSQYYADAYGAIYEAKLSSANEQEQLTAVSFGLRNTQATVDIKVYRLEQANFGNVNDEINMPDSGTVIGQKNQVYFEDDGFYTVDFDRPINLAQGEIFSIVISGTDSKGGFLNPYFAIDSYESVNDMTYRKYMGEWTSFKGYKNTYPGNTAGSCVRLRAITNIVATENSFDNNLQYARMELSSKLLYYEKGKPQTPELMVYFGNKILQEDEDYRVTYIANIKPGKATVKITGINNYYGEQSVAFEIAKPKYPPGMINERIEVYSDTIRLSQVPVPDGWKWQEDLVLVSGDSGWGYQMKYMGDDADCYQLITCSVKIYKNNYARPPQLDIDGSTVTIYGKYSYTGSQIEPSLRVVCKGHELKLNKDYVLDFQNNTNVGIATVTIKGCGGYSGQIKKEFEIKKAKWPNKRPPSTIYVGKDIKNLSQIPLNCPGWSWQEHLEITNDNFQSTAIYIDQDISNYSNTKMIITIIRESETEQKNIASITELRLDTNSFVYDGQSKTPNVIARDGTLNLIKGVDFEVEYKDNTLAGQASVIVRGKNKYIGTRTLTFTIEKANRQNFEVIQHGWIYGDESMPTPEIGGEIETANVTFLYSNAENGSYNENKPTNAGTYWIKAEIAATQNCNSAVAKAKFTIAKAEQPAQMPSASMTVTRKIKTLQSVDLVTGWQWEYPDMVIDAESIKAYAVYYDKINYKNYRMEITITKESPKDVSELSVDIESSAFVYDGTFKTPKVMAKDGERELSLGTDYNVQYKSNKFAGQGKVIVTFKNDYKGTKEFTFTILQAEKPSVNNTTILFNKKAKKLSEIPLPEGFVWYDGNVEISENKLTAKAIYEGEDASSYKITELYFEIIIEEQELPNQTDKPEQGSMIWLAIVIPVAVLIVAGVGFAITMRMRNKRRKNK